MKYYVLIGNMIKKPAEIPNFKGVLNEHHAYLKAYKDKGDVLLSGPKKEGWGGIILVRMENESIQSFIENDPFIKAGIQEYEVTEFTIFDRQDYTKYPLIKSSYFHYKKLSSEKNREKALLINGLLMIC